MLLVLQVVSSSAFAVRNIATMDDDAETTKKGVVVSVEGLTLGQGFYVEPTFVAYEDVAAEFKCTEADITASMVSGYLFKQLGIETNPNTYDDPDFYMAAMKGVDKGYVEVPEVITNAGGDAEEGNADEWLGQMDYNTMGGWMITVDDFMLPVGAGNWKMENNDQEPAANMPADGIHTIRWQFSLYGYGLDLGIDTGWGTPYFVGGKRADLYKAIVNYRNNALYTTNADYKTAIDAYVTACEQLDLTQEDIDLLLAQIKVDADSFKTEEPVVRESRDISKELKETLDYIYETNSTPKFGFEWSLMTLARAGYMPLDSEYFNTYYQSVVEKVQTVGSNIIDKNKSTENSRTILALSAINKDARNVGGYDLVAALDDIAFVSKQGLNGGVYALIALDTRNYETTDPTLRDQIIDLILSKEIEGGGWALWGKNPDPDMTCMTMISLAPYAEKNEQVAAALERGLAVVQRIQKDDGTFSSGSEGSSQAIVALTAMGINPSTDERFIKNDNSIVDGLMQYYVENGGFKHVLTGNVNAMSSYQGCYALVAYDRLLKGENRLYDMTDVMTEEPVNPEYDENGFLKIESYINTPAIVTNKAGSTFNAQIGLTGWDSTKDYKLVDMIVTVPEGLRVTDVQATNNLTGGSVYYYVEEATGKLRVVYANLETYENVVVNATEFPADLFTVTFTMDEVLEAKTVDFAITGMSLKLGSDSQDPKMIHVINTMTDSSKATSELKKEVAVFAYELYTGDGIDIIPADKKAVAVLVTELEVATTITYTDGTVLRYNKQLSDKTGVATYVTMVAAETSMDEMNKVANYTMVAGTPASITFGDVNADGVINAQDALDTVNAWLRKTEVTTDDTMLAMNVNGDSRINTYDALGIVDNFVNGTEFIVVTYGARFSAN